MRQFSSPGRAVVVGLSAVVMLSACAPQYSSDPEATASRYRRTRSVAAPTTTTSTTAAPQSGLKAPSTPSVVAPAPAAPPSTDPRTPVVTEQQLIDDTHMLHENGQFPYTAKFWGSAQGPSFSYVDTHPYTQTPGPTDWVSNYSGGLAGMHPWYELTTEENSPTNLDAKVEMSRIGLAVHRKSTNKWDTLYATGSYIPQAYSWDNGYNYLPDVKTSAGDRVMGLGLGNFAQSVYESSLGGNGRIRAHGWSEAGWDNGRSYFHNSAAVAADVDAVEAWITVRVTGADAAKSQYRIMPGFDVMKLGTDVPSPPQGSWPGFQGRARHVSPEWQTFTVSTMSNAMLTSLPSPPVPGFTRAAAAPTQNVAPTGGSGTSADPGTSTGGSPATSGGSPATGGLGAGTYDDAASSIVYGSGWTLDSGGSNFMGTQHYTNVAGRSATFTINGSSLDIYGGKAHDMGRLSVSIDGQAPVVLDAFDPNTQFNVLLGRLSGLGSGSHTVTITSASTRNAAADGNYVSLDRLVVG